MATWNEWFAHLDGRLSENIAIQLPEVHEFIRGVEQSRSDLGLKPERPRSPALDDLSSLVLFIDYLEETARESHYKAASSLYAQGRNAAWMPAALPNSEDSRVAKRLIQAASPDSAGRMARCRRS